ncbi:hypothetical protein TGRUB_279540 [Toxoplasma gondii RUB]|uniref:Uncharacterized protein n=2 Tax=Toxoplasma gondii TaxID=5811 RepID=V4YII2_TOXGV|nr:hypothetical protein TGVEG_279540 [Toxoplasma gondii VEG]KFG56692.1 hypothetical protein TGRUB_279540 [Toxoplasma gondii RUB]
MPLRCSFLQYAASSIVTFDCLLGFSGYRIATPPQSNDTTGGSHFEIDVNIYGVNVVSCVEVARGQRLRRPPETLKAHREKWSLKRTH